MGYVAAIRAAQLGGRVILIDEHLVSAEVLESRFYLRLSAYLGQSHQSPMKSYLDVCYAVDWSSP
jgi:hypothetical protein